MRVTPEVRDAEQRRDARRGDFSSALERAEARRTERARAEDGRVSHRAGERLWETRLVAARGQRAVDGGGSGKTPPPGSSAADGDARSGPDEMAGQGGSAAPLAGAVGRHATGPGGPVALVPAGEPARAALGRAVRALPPVIEAFRASGQAGLTIDFGGAMGVELCQAPGGVEVRLAAPAALRPAARAELAGLCHALAARGVSVVSAEVRGGPPHRSRQR